MGGYADELGEMVIPPVYDLAEEFFDGLAHVKKSGCGFYIDKRGLYHRRRNLP